ncbi:protein phosphatase 2C domain-containing protein [Paenibacillus albiflavus]|uniref:protein phosphatase 2C domain-containing protein n=1 Tax=Paenibacillus albiflavus TaxID=2545760 RepID=UPI0014050CF6|nr:protein phosphatase 2C domain-containing protein [Paenibacillus albiflavus]
MIIEKLTIQGCNEWNEDALIASEAMQIFGVLDGATSLKPFRGPNQETGGYLVSNLVKRELESLDVTELDAFPLHELVLRANARLRREMLESGIDVYNKEELWTAGIALVRIHENYIEYVQAGDCMIAVSYKDGVIRTVSHDQVDHIDAQTMRMWRDGIHQGIKTCAELRKLVEPTILHNKRTMNTLDGYAAISGEPELSEYIEYGRINRMQMTDLLIVSDGLFLPRSLDANEPPRDSGIEGLMRHVQKQNLHNYTDWLLNLEETDPECLKYPRFKKSDDKTGIYIRFE